MQERDGTKYPVADIYQWNRIRDFQKSIQAFSQWESRSGPMAFTESKAQHYTKMKKDNILCKKNCYVIPQPQLQDFQTLEECSWISLCSF